MASVLPRGLGPSGSLSAIGASEERITDTRPLTLTRNNFPINVKSNQAMSIGRPVDLRSSLIPIFNSLQPPFGTAIPELGLRGGIFLELGPTGFSDSTQSHLAPFMFCLVMMSLGFIESRAVHLTQSSRTKRASPSTLIHRDKFRRFNNNGLTQPIQPKLPLFMIPFQMIATPRAQQSTRTSTNLKGTPRASPNLTISPNNARTRRRRSRRGTHVRRPNRIARQPLSNLGLARGARRQPTGTIRNASSAQIRLRSQKLLFSLQCIKPSRLNATISLRPQQNVMLSAWHTGEPQHKRGGAPSRRPKRARRSP